MKNRFYPYLISLFSYLLISCFPWGLIIKNDIYLLISLQILFQGLFLIGISIYVVHNKNLVHKEKRISLYFLLPLFLICFSNYIYPLCIKNSYLNSFSLYSYLRITLCLFLVINEEIVFRYLGFKFFENQYPLARIIYTSLIFGLSHLSIYLSTFNPMDLLIILYTFGLGLVLGFIYEYHGNILIPITLHLLFNIFNDAIFSSLFIVEYYHIVIFISITISILIGGYILFLYLKFLRISKTH